MFISKNNVTTLNNDQSGFVGILGGLVRLVFGLIVGILALRFVFRLLGANEANAIVSWIYQTSAPLVAPFFGIFNQTVNLATGRFEFETLLAILVYGVIGALVSGIFDSGRRR